MSCSQKVLSHTRHQRPRLLPLHVLLQSDSLQRTPPIKVFTHELPRRAVLLVFEAPRNGREVPRLFTRGLFGVDDDVRREAGEMRRFVEGRVSGCDGGDFAGVGGGFVGEFAVGLHGDALEAGHFGGVFGCGCGGWVGHVWLCLCLGL